MDRLILTLGMNKQERECWVTVSAITPSCDQLLSAPAAMLSLL